jgi:diadenosine tetraphosphate (Ap4A) HIT family hydrolase
MTSDPAAGWRLDPQLERDTSAIDDLPLCRALLMADANYPWLILVPRRAGASEIVDLGPQDRAALLDEIARASEALRRVTSCDKLNVAAIGNVVAQLHVHVVARFRSDAAWPRPVWGAGPPKPYDPPARDALLARLRAELSLPPRA